MKRRSRNELIENILHEASKDWIAKTYLQNRTHIPFESFKNYYRALIGAGLLEERKPTGERYQCKTTERGKRLLVPLKQSSIMLEEFKKLFY